MKTVLIFLLILALLVACAPAQQNGDLTESRISRYIDREYNVVCYYYITGYGIGLSCVPLKDLK